MTKDDVKLANALITLYQKFFLEVHGRVSTINRYKFKYGMIDVIESVGYDRAKVLLAYYFKTSKPGHPLPFFLSNFDRMDEMERRQSEDTLRRKDIMYATKKMVEEREAQVEHGKSSNLSDLSEQGHWGPTTG